MKLKEMRMYIILILVTSIVTIAALATNIFVFRILGGIWNAYMVVSGSILLIDLIREIKKDRHPPMTAGEYIDSNYC